jgi:membrane-bound serine protease (ClpP class)
MSETIGIEAAAVFLGAGAIAAALCLAIAAFAQRFGSDAHRVGDRFGEEPVTVLDWSGRSGRVSAGGEDWRARSTEPLTPGESVDVVKAQGLTLVVRKTRAVAETGD